MKNLIGKILKGLLVFGIKIIMDNDFTTLLLNDPIQLT